MNFLSDEWFAAFADALARIDSKAIAAVRLCVQHRVERPEGLEPIRYWIRVDDGKISVERGEATDADVSVTTDAETAAALAFGTASAQDVFRAGRLRLHGDVARLMAWSEALRSTGDPFASLRARTVVEAT